MKPMTAKQASAFLKKYNKWRKGEIDDWSKKSRVPPPSEIDRFMNKVQELIDKEMKETDTWSPKGEV